MGQPQHPLPAALPEVPLARHLGDLGRADERWQVFLETRPQGKTVGGRVHFLQGEQTRASAWILLEWSEQDVLIVSMSSAPWSSGACWRAWGSFRPASGTGAV